MGTCVSFVCGPPGLGIESRYILQRRVGRGATGDVWLGIERLTGVQYALKVQDAGRDLRPIDAKRIIREIQLSVELGEGHVNIIRPHELILTNKHLVLATEYSAGGTLESYAKKKLINEDLALYLFLQIVRAVQYCHSRNIVYRDMKPVNVLLDGSEPPVVQLCDFGVAKRAGMGKGADIHRLTTFTGTAGFLAPEVITVGLETIGSGRVAHAYDGTKSDVWGLGVLLFVLLVHELPFFVDELDMQLDPAHALKDTLAKEQAANWVDALGPSQRQVFLGCSTEVQDLLGRMFDKEEGTRATIEEILAHPWCRRELPPILQNKLRFLEEEQAKIDSESDRPRYCVAGGDKLVEEFMERVFSDEYREQVKRFGHVMVDSLMLTWSGLQREELGLPRPGDAADAVRFAAEWAEEQVRGAQAGGAGAEGSLREPQSAVKMRTNSDASKRNASVRVSATSGAQKAASSPPSPGSSRRSSLSGGEGSPGAGTPRAGAKPSAAQAPYKSRTRISQIITQRAGEDGSVISAWSPSPRRGPGTNASLSRGTSLTGSDLGPPPPGAASASGNGRRSTFLSGAEGGGLPPPSAGSAGPERVQSERLDAADRRAPPAVVGGAAGKGGGGATAEAEEVVLKAAPQGKGKKAAG